MCKAVFLDKDGVINSLVLRSDGRMTSPWTLAEFKDRLYPHVKESITRLKDMGFSVFVVTNQPGVLDGEMFIVELDSICEYLEEELGVNHVLYALKKDTNLYKPNTGMIDSLMRIYEINSQGSYMIGDRWKDIVPGNKCMLTTILVGNEHAYDPPEEYIDMSEPYHVASDLAAAVAIIEMEFKNGVR